MSKETIKHPDNKDNKYKEKQWSPEYNGNYSDNHYCTAIDNVADDFGYIIPGQR